MSQIRNRDVPDVIDDKELNATNVPAKFGNDFV
jgi:hypothetical protein